MIISDKRLIRTFDGQIVEAGPGVSGTLVVGIGAELTEDRARELGIIGKKVEQSSPVSTPIDRATGKPEEVKPIVEGKPWETAKESLPKTIGTPVALSLDKDEPKKK